MYQAFRNAGDRLYDVHVADNNRMACGQGQLDWARIIGTLQDMGYDGSITVEFVPPLDRTPANPYKNAMAAADETLTPEQLKFIEDHGSGVLSEEFYSWLVEESVKTLPEPHVGAPWHRRDVQVLLALVLAATALRPQLVGVGPLLPRISDDLGMPHWQAGLLGTIPVLCMGLFALPAGKVASWIGTKRAVGICVLAIGVFGLARAASESALPLIALTIPVGVAMGLVGALVPVAAKERFSTRPALATGVYTTGIQIGATAATLAAVPLAVGATWNLPLAVFSAAAVLGAIAWFVLGPEAAPRSRPTRATRCAARPAVARCWDIVAFFALMSLIYYGFIAWLPGAYVEHGWTEASAAAVLAVLTAAQIPGGMIVAALADERRRVFVLAFAARGARSGRGARRRARRRLALVGAGRAVDRRPVPAAR